MELKDFAYIDFERIRSYVAQQNGGLREQLSKTTTHEMGASAVTKSGAALNWFVDAGVDGNYMYTKSSSETSSLHHAIFDVFESRVIKDEMVGDLGDAKPFVKLSCNLRIMDYGLLAKQIKSTSKLLPIIDRIMVKKSDGGQTRQQRKQEDKDRIKSAEDIANVIELLFGDTRVLEFIDENGVVMVKSYLNEDILPTASVFFAENNEVLPDLWIILALKPLAARIPKEITPTDELGINLQKASEALATFRRQIMTSKNAPNIVPLAIYKNIV